LKHNCQYKYDDDPEGEVYTPFFDAIMDGSFEYDDWYDAYTWLRPRYKRKRWYWPFETHTMSIDILGYCPFCGSKIADLKHEVFFKEEK
jgi:hypothetical protein